MSASNAAPNDTKFRSILYGLCAVDVSDTLAEVELSILSGLNTLQFDEGHVGVLVTLGPLVAKHTTLAVQTIYM